MRLIGCKHVYFLLMSYEMINSVKKEKLPTTTFKIEHCKFILKIIDLVNLELLHNELSHDKEPF